MHSPSIQVGPSPGMRQVSATKPSSRVKYSRSTPRSIGSPPSAGNREVAPGT